MKDEELVLSESETISTEVVYQQDKAAIDMQIATAKAYPRNITRSVNNAIAIVSMDKETAKTCTYSVPRGNKPITGKSVHLAKIVAQAWGNMRIEAKVVGIDATHVTSEAVCFDLESNLAIKTQVKRSIVGKHGRYNDDMITVTGNAANAIALRNAILNVVPTAVTDKVYEASKQTLTGDVSSETKLIARRKQVIDGLKDAYGVSEAEILASIGKASVTHISADDLVVLIGIGTAIKDGDTTIEQAFRSKPIVKTDEEVELHRVQQVLADLHTISEIAAFKETLPTLTDAMSKAIRIRENEVLNPVVEKKGKSK